MNAEEHGNDVSQDELSISAVERLVNYDEAKANGDCATVALQPGDADSEELACVDLLHRVWPDIEPPATTDENGQPKMLGDFRLLQELGRGGMGTVFEAEQISMGRHVALKVLPFAALVHENSLQRFRNEVRAAAALNHPHIVPVYSIGEERGVHFYAMQLIRGGTVADLIDELRPHARENGMLGLVDSTHPTAESMSAPSEQQALISTAVDSRRDAESYRAAARLGIQAGEALQHAHDQGVLHRDIKPSNLMLDREGKLYVTDFGLARIEADAGMTMTGDILGTLRYMAPEQALAKRIVVDHRADVYSLGATLYELLTLQPAFGETDRTELLKQIAFDEPRPLRKLDHFIPAELETIVLKAMAKNPDERYQTAQQLADDLLAFLEQRPIAAKPLTILDRASKWSRRHVGLVRAGIVSLLVILGLSTVSMVVVAQLYREANAQRITSEGQTILAERERRRAELLLASAQLQSGIKLLDQGQPSGLLDLVDARLTAGEHPTGQSAARLWAAAIATLKFQLVHVVPEVGIPCFSPDGSQLAITSGKVVHVRDVASGRELFEPLKLDEKIHALVYSPDGSLIAAHSWRGVAQVWKSSNGKPASPVLRHENSKPSDVDPSGVAAFSPDGKLFATGGADSTIRLWYVEDWKLLGEPLHHQGTVLGLAFVSDGKGLVSLSADNVLHLWDLSDDKVRQKTKRGFNVHFGGPLAVSRTGKLIFHLDESTQPAVTKVADFTVQKQLDYRSTLVSGSFSPDDRLVATASSDWTVRLWDAETGTPFGNIMKHAARVRTVRFNHKGNLLASGSIDRTVLIWDTETQRRVGLPLYSDNQVSYVEFSPRDDYLVFNGWNTSRLWKVASDTTATTAKRKQTPQQETPSWISPNGKYRATIADGRVVLSAENAGDTKPITLRHDYIRSAAFNSDSTLLATGADDWFVNIWEASTGRLIKRWNAHERVYGVAFSPIDPMTLVTAQFDGTARLWNVATEQPLGLPMKHDAPVWEVAFDPSGKMIVTASGEEYLRPDRIRLWDIATAAPYPSVALPFQPMVSNTPQSSWSSTFESFDKDGTLFVRDADDGSAREWRLSKPPSDAQTMRNTTWLTLGIRRSLEGTDEAIGATEWQKLADEACKGGVPQ